ncbi:MAG: alpha/beta hydrolase [Hydrogenophaga sp.]|nr:alpha/beta hydrolase [Hydrogenophaga sp.]
MREIDAETVRRTVLSDGLEFHHVEAGQGTPLVFLHGVLGDWRTWAPQWPAFVPHFRCIAYSRRYNWPNRNLRAQPDHSAFVEADDLSRLMDTWQTGPAVLVGSSYGAFTALSLAVRHPDKVRALVLLEPPMLRWADFSEAGRRARETFEREVREPARRAFLDGDIQRGVLLLTGGIVGAQAMEHMPPQSMERRLQNAESIRMLTLSTDEFPMISAQDLRDVRAPTLLLAGEQTPTVHDAVFRNVCAVMTQARTGRISNAGHGAARDNPQAFNRLTRSFLEEAGLWT